VTENRSHVDPISSTPAKWYPGQPTVSDAHQVGPGEVAGLQRALVRAGKFPCSVIRVHRTYRVPTVGLLGLLEINPKSLTEPDSGAVPGAPLELPRETPAARV
jgi:hypothetical protein